MTETADQLLSHVVPICQWIPQISHNPSSTLSAYPRFSSDVREWVEFFQDAKLKQYHIPGGQFPISPTIAQSLRVEKDAETRFYFNILGPIQTLLETQGATFCGRCPGLLGSPDYVLCTNDSTVAKIPLEIKTQFNLNLCSCHLWQIYRKADQDQITDQNLQFKKRILSQIFSAMACNGLHYGILSNYSATYFFKRAETSKTTLYVTRVAQPNDTNPTLRECVYYISQLAINDSAGEKLKCIRGNNISSNGFDDETDDTDDNSDNQDYTYGSSSDDNDSSDNYDDDYPSKKIKRGSKKAGNSKK
ncbi:hypothetical protein Glove_421g31 [Diversispora epigaea]|uniref:Uncharacterized protein n=1 Tax=Diversispora epigaea TaxID=1348612 RepID=A0A397GXA3_9GLOM|nr:hypothetical protein Glove_421g31 [Diversispora epigaea]